MIASPTSPNLYSQHYSSSTSGSSRSSPRNVWNRPVSRSSRSSMLAGRQQRSASASLADMQSTSTRSPRPREHLTRDTGTQYSSPETPDIGSKPSTATGKRKGREADSPESIPEEQSPRKPRLTPQTFVPATAPANPIESAPPITSTASHAASTSANTGDTSMEEEAEDEDAETSTTTPAVPNVRILPSLYENCPTSDLVPIIASMLLELIRHNDDMPVTDTGLTRFHSRAPPGISVQDYLQRLAHHATLSPPILLAMVYYIDRICTLWPKFTINSLTVHRYLIASATVASKGLSDSFWTNATYARVGGVSLKELALLELEFLWRIEWRIVPKPEVLVDYYRSLVKRCEGYQIEAGFFAPAVPSGSDASSSSRDALLDDEMSG